MNGKHIRFTVTSLFYWIGISFDDIWIGICCAFSGKCVYVCKPIFNSNSTHFFSDKEENIGYMFSVEHSLFSLTDWVSICFCCGTTIYLFNHCILLQNLLCSYFTVIWICIKDIFSLFSLFEYLPRKTYTVYIFFLFLLYSH